MKDIPKSTRSDWNDFEHQHYYGYEWVEDYVNQFDDIKAVFSRKYLYKTIRLMCNLSDGYHNILDEVTSKKKIIRKQADKIISSIDRMVKHTGNSIRKICRVYGIAEHWYYEQKRKFKCNVSKTRKCFKQYSNQLTLEESSTIERIVSNEQNKNKSLITLYYEAMWKEVITCGKSTFYRYANLFGYTRPKKGKSKRKVGFKSSRPFQWLHVDVTLVKTIRDGLQKVVFIKDNFSKAILNYASFDSPVNSANIKSMLVDTFERYNLNKHKEDINILSDGGSENKGEVLKWVEGLKAPPIVSKITAGSLEFPAPNNMSESTHKIFKSEFLQSKDSESRKQHLLDLDLFVKIYNYERYPSDFYGYTPIQVLNGYTPNKRLFSNRIQMAKRKRVKTNQNFKQCIVGVGCR